MDTSGMGSLGQIELTLEPTEVAEWDEEDLAGADRGPSVSSGSG